MVELDSPTVLRSTVSVQLALLASGLAVARALVAEGVEPEAVAGMSGKKGRVEGVGRDSVGF